MMNSDLYRVPVTPELRERIWNLKEQNDNATWRALQDAIPDWRWSFATLADLAHGRQSSTNIAIYEALGIKPPLIIEVHPGSAIFGEIGLLNIRQVSVMLVLLPDEWQRHAMECEVCGASCPRWSSTQKYCSKHSWETKEGRRYWRGRNDR